MYVGTFIINYTEAAREKSMRMLKFKGRNELGRDHIRWVWKSRSVCVCVGVWERVYMGEEHAKVCIGKGGFETSDERGRLGSR